MLTTNRGDLAKATAAVARLAPGKTVMPILSTVKLWWAGESVSATCTNLEQTLTLDLAGEAEGAGETCVDARRLAEWLSYQTAERVTLELDKKRLVVRAGRAKAELSTLDPDDFPPSPETEGEPTVTLPADTLASLIEQTAYATAKDESRPVLFGIRWAVADGLLRLAAADGYRLAVAQAPFDGPAWSAIVPGPSCLTLAKLLEAGGDVRLWQAGSQLVARAGEATYATRLLDGQYPDYQRIVPTEPACRVTFDRAELERELRAGAGLSADAAEGVARLQPDADAGLLRLSGRSDTGSYEAEIAAEIEGVPCKISFNERYLRDALAHLSGERTELWINGSASPARLGQPGDMAAAAQVVMPVYVAGEAEAAA